LSSLDYTKFRIAPLALRAAGRLKDAVDAGRQLSTQLHRMRLRMAAEAG
jgi:hypothetical protein